jgi:hypothetical protein
MHDADHERFFWVRKLLWTFGQETSQIIRSKYGYCPWQQSPLRDNPTYRPDNL